jgi:phytoene synthase
VIARLLAEADRLYHRAEAGIAHLPASCRAGIGAARLLYAEIGRALGREGGNSVDRRAVVPTRRKLALLAASAARGATWPTARLDEPPLSAARFLVDAALAVPRPEPRRDLESRVAWLVGLYDRLERRDRTGRFAAGRWDRQDGSLDTAVT